MARAMDWTSWVSSSRAFLPGFDPMFFTSYVLYWEHGAKSDSVVHTREYELWKGPSILPHFLLCHCQGPSRYRNCQDQSEHYFNDAFLFLFLSLHSNFCCFWQ